MEKHGQVDKWWYCVAKQSIVASVVVCVCVCVCVVGLGTLCHKMQLLCYSLMLLHFIFMLTTNSNYAQNYAIEQTCVIQ